MSKLISINNGLSYVSALDVDAETLETHWSSIVDAMDDQICEALHYEMPEDASHQTFLRAYLDRAPRSLVIG